METLDENLEKIDDVELIDDSNNDDILVDETEEKKENNIFDTVIDVNDEEALLDEEIVKEELVNKRQIDENTDIEIIKTSNNYDPSSFNQGSNLKMMKPYTRVRKPFNKYGSFTEINSTRAGFTRMAGLGSLIAVGVFLVLYLILKK